MLNELRPDLPEGCLSNLTLDEWKADELDATRAAEVARHTATCPRCSQRNREIDAAAAAFREGAPALPPAALGARIGAPRAEKPRRFAAVARAGAVVLALAAGAALFLRPQRDGDVTRSKGAAAHLTFFVKRGERVFEGGNDERLHPRDQVRFVVTTDRRRYLAILSLDGAGVASVYYPTSGAPAMLGPARDAALEHSTELDGTLGEERIYALFCDQPIDLARERATLATTHAVVPASHCSVDTLGWTKEP